MMQCERAQEFFSDYLERTLDRPMAVALEAHLASCHPCRDDVEALQTTFLDLAAVPEVETPPSGVYQVMSRLREVAVEPREEQRRPAPSFVFLQWLRSLSPARTAMSAGLATVVVAGAMLVPGVPEHIRNTFAPGTVQPTTTQPVTFRPSAGPTTIQVVLGPQTAAGQTVKLQVAADRELSNAQVRVISQALSQEWTGAAAMISPTRSALVPVVLPASTRAESLRITVTAGALGKESQHLVVLPPGERRSEPVDLVLEGGSLDEALQSVAQYLDRPVVTDGVADGSIRLGVTGESARRCLDDIAAQVGAEAIMEASVYRLVPLR